MMNNLEPNSRPSTPSLSNQPVGATDPYEEGRLGFLVCLLSRIGTFLPAARHAIVWASMGIVFVILFVRAAWTGGPDVRGRPELRPEPATVPWLAPDEPRRAEPEMIARAW